MFFKNKKILKAAKEGDVELLKECLDLGVSKNALQQAWGQIFNSSNGHDEGRTLDMVKMITQYRVNIDSYIGAEETALTYTTKMGFCSIVKYLIDQGADQDEEVHFYGGGRAIDKVRYLDKELQKKIYPYFKDWHEACFRQLSDEDDLTDAQKLIEEFPNEISVHCKEDVFRLISCSGRDRPKGQVLKTIDLLLAHGADLNGQDSSGDTVLSDAAEGGVGDVVQYLIELGADEYIKNNNGRTAFDRADDGMQKYFAEYASIAEEEKRQNREKENAKKLINDGSVWLLVDKTQVAHIEDQKPIQQQLREVFNFHTKSVLTVVRNTNTNAESCFENLFAQYANQDRLAQACDFANKNGQNIDKEAILDSELKMMNGRLGQKMKIKLPK